MSDPWFKFYPSDWLAGTRGLTAAETGVYITLIAMMYERGPLLQDRAHLARLCGCPAGAFSRALDALIAAEKIIETPDGLWNGRVDRERKAREIKSRNGSDAASKRWAVQAEKDEENQSLVDADVSVSQCQNDANTRSQKPDTPKAPKGAEPEGFAEFWGAYPKRDGGNPRKPASDKFATALRKGATPEAMLAAARAYAGECERSGKTGTPYVAQAVTWLNQERWRDYLAAPAPQAARPPADYADHWRWMLRRYLDNGRLWTHRGFAEPGKPECTCPRKILAEFGLLQREDAA